MSDIDPYDADADHLSLSGATPAIRRDARRAATKRRTIAAIKAHGNVYSSASPALRSAAERNFGSWAKACIAAGIDPPKRGRPPGSGVNHGEQLHAA